MASLLGEDPLPYRAPAEDPDAKDRALLDAEIAVFARTMAKKTPRQKASVVLALGLTVAIVALTVIVLSNRSVRTVGPRPGCHVAYDMELDNVGGHITRHEIVVCPDGG